MLMKRKFPLEFESSVNLQGSKTISTIVNSAGSFESSVNLQGSKTKVQEDALQDTFESSVNLQGSKTVLQVWEQLVRLRVV